MIKNVSILFKILCASASLRETHFLDTLKFTQINTTQSPQKSPNEKLTTLLLTPNLGLRF